MKHGVLKDEIAKLIGRTDINQFNKTWTRALSPVFGVGENKDALSLCIDYTLEAIGRLDKEEDRRKLEEFEELFRTSTVKKPKKAKSDSIVIKTKYLNPYLYLSLSLKSLKRLWQWIKSHKVRSTVGTALIIVITLLGTNWDTVVSNWNKCISFIRSIF